MDIVDVVPISDLRVRQREVLERIQEGPVVLAQQSRPAAVLLSSERWRGPVPKKLDQVLV